MMSGCVLVKYINFPMSLLYDVGSGKASPLLTVVLLEKFIGVETGA